MLQKAPYMPGFGKDYATRYREQYTNPKPDQQHKSQRPCMLAVPIYPDGLPYISRQVPPVLVEWDTKVEEWVATAPAFDVSGNSVQEPPEVPSMPASSKYRHAPPSDTSTGKITDFVSVPVQHLTTFIDNITKYLC